MDATFRSPDRPLAAVNPLGAPAVDVLGVTDTWVRRFDFVTFVYHLNQIISSVSFQISLDEFGRTPGRMKRGLKRQPVKSHDDDVITCSRKDCANPNHIHKPLIDISDNDSGLLLTINDQSDNQNPAKSNNETENDKENCDFSCSAISSSTHTSVNLSIDESPSSFHQVGYSQCKSGKIKKQTRHRPVSPQQDLENPDIRTDRLKKKVNFDEKTPKKFLFESPRPVGKLLETPDSSKNQIIYVEDTPEHLVGLRMVTRRLRKMLQAQNVPDSLDR